MGDDWRIPCSGSITVTVYSLSNSADIVTAWAGMVNVHVFPDPLNSISVSPMATRVPAFRTYPFSGTTINAISSFSAAS